MIDIQNLESIKNIASARAETSYPKLFYIPRTKVLKSGTYPKDYIIDSTILQDTARHSYEQAIRDFVEYLVEFDTTEEVYELIRNLKTDIENDRNRPTDQTVNKGWHFGQNPSVKSY